MEKQRLLNRNSELNFEKDALEQRAAELSAALTVNITTTVKLQVFMAMKIQFGGPCCHHLHPEDGSSIIPVASALQIMSCHYILLP
jgi:hypothetical protein